MDIIPIGAGSHLPTLIKTINVSTGPVLELGMGTFSTHYLHWACYESKRKLVSFENKPECFEWAKDFRNDYHDVNLITDWDSIDLSGHWGVVLIDHAPTPRRKHEIRKLADRADYVVIHDSEPEREGWQKLWQIYPLFKYRKDFGRENPLTTVLSNFKDLSDL